VRKICDASLVGALCVCPDMTDVGALPIPDGAPIAVSAAEGITTVTALVDTAVCEPWREAESRRRRLMSAPMSAAV
jgi:hypothetical protein